MWKWRKCLRFKVRMHANTAAVTGAYDERGKSDGKPYEYHDRLTESG
jgi:hypothetical protein